MNVKIETVDHDDYFSVNRERDGAFSPPRIPIRPVLEGLFPRTRTCMPGVLDASSICFVTSGRMAIALALRECGVDRDSEVLVSAYHCSSMIMPILALGAKPVYYPIEEDLNIDPAQLSSRITAKTKAALVPHFFGFPQQHMDLITEELREREVVVVEDCAHTFFGKTGGRSVGSWGDYAIASAMKFFPVTDGGVLVSAYRDLSGMDIRPGGLGFGLRSFVNAVEFAHAYNRLPVTGTFVHAMQKIRTLSGRIRGRKGTGGSIPAASRGGYHFDPAWMNIGMSRFSRYVVESVDHAELARKRRRRYEYLVENLRDIPGFKVLKPDLGTNDIPYVCPILVSESEKIFAPLKERGVPIVRFGEYLARDVDASVCSVSVEYSRNVFQFPCHQALRWDEVEWMVDVIREVVSGR